MPAPKPFTFVCGSDDFLVGRAARERYDVACAEVTDEFSREVVNGFATRVDEVAEVVNRFRDAVQTVPLFGGTRLVWLKDVSFLADNPTGRAEGTLRLVADLQELLAANDPAQVIILVSAAPVDRRRAFPKWCEKNGDCIVLGGDGDGATEALAGVVQGEARSLGATLTPDALSLLLTRTGANTRLLVEEVHKLASYAAGDPPASDAPVTIEESHVAELTPNVAEGDFFATAEAFFRGDLAGTLHALHHHFFTGGDARPVISSLQNRNRLLIQLRALSDSGDLRLGGRGLDKGALERAAQRHGHHFGAAISEKTGFNIFAQHPFYLSRLVNGPLPSLRQLIDNQQEFTRAFSELIDRPQEQEDVLREMIVRCLTPGRS